MQEHHPSTDDRAQDPNEHDPASASVEQLLADLRDPDMLARATLSFGLNTLTRPTHDALAPDSDPYSLGAIMLSVLQRGHRIGYDVGEATEDGVFVIEPEQSPAHVVFSRYATLNVPEWKIGNDDRRRKPVIEAEYMLTEIGSPPDIVMIEFTISNATSVGGTRNLHYLVTKVTLDPGQDDPADEEPTHRQRSRLSRYWRRLLGAE
jgi:hypothetical protein